MLIRIFAAPTDTVAAGLDKYLNFLRLEFKNTTEWKVEHCDPLKWGPCNGDINIFIDTPVRLAVPWAKYNVYITDFGLNVWDWAKTEMDLVLTKQSISSRDTVLPTFRRIFRSAVKGSHPLFTPIENTKSTELPKVGIITVTRNRKEWWVNMVQNVVKQNWPMTRLEWIIVDDGDANKRLKDDIEVFMDKSPGVTIRYVDMETPRSIGAKRNAAVEAASEDVSVFVVMDDDDHYPAASIAKRVSWLNRTMPKDKETKKEKAQSQIAYCSVIPMYDITRYISAMNVPQLDIGPAERVSEATLAFTREAWVSRPFPDVSMAEGLGFLEGRESISVEIPPKDVIVSFIHTSNSSSRRIPAGEEPNGCHYGFSNEFFKYVHSIGGAAITTGRTPIENSRS
jgi:hypothetical protein